MIDEILEELAKYIVEKFCNYVESKATEEEYIEFQEKMRLLAEILEKIMRK